MYENNIKGSIWRTEHARDSIDISENGKIDILEQFKTTSIAQDPFDPENKVIRFELNRVDPKFYAKYSCDDDEHFNSKDDVSLDANFNASKQLYCGDCTSSPLGLNFNQWRTHMNRNEIAIDGPRRKLYKKNKELWFGLQMLIHEEYELEEAKVAEVVTQFHVKGRKAKYPPVVLAITEGRYVLIINKKGYSKNERYDLGPVVKNKWTKWEYHLVFSKRDKKGLIEVWRDGEKLVSVIGRNKVRNYKAYLKIGVYKANWWDCKKPSSFSRRKMISFDKIWASKTPNDG